MSTAIKLTRIGRKNNPKYRIVVAHKGIKRDGRYLEKIGFYDPITNPHRLEVDHKRLDYWISTGAQLSDGMVKLLGKKLKKSL